MHIEDAFWESIRQTPDDDAPRLIYADWLDDNGDAVDQARAAFIRAQCGLERLTEDDPARPGLEAEAKGILKAHEKKWTAALRKAKLVSAWTFRRGFVDAVTMKAPRFAVDGEKVFKLVPLLRAVRFPEASNEVRQLAASPFLARLTEVDLHEMCACGHCPIQAELRVLFASPHVANLTRLTLSGDRIDLETVRALAGSPHLAGLTYLDLRDNAITTAGARALAGAASLANLRRLLVGGNKVGPVGARLLRARFADRVEV